ncbi:44487_t:CDS:2, partial [Gigaspora margarita]
AGRGVGLGGNNYGNGNPTIDGWHNHVIVNVVVAGGVVALNLSNVGPATEALDNNVANQYNSTEAGIICTWLALKG